VTRTKAEFWVRCDFDDPLLDKYRQIKLPLMRWRLVIGKRARAGAAMRELFALEPHHDSYLQMGDDTIPRTDEWDQKLEESALAFGMSYPDDCIWGMERITHPVTSGKVLREMGFWTLPELTHLYTDTVLQHIGSVLRCAKYRPDVVLEHLHFSTGKSPYDDVYRRVDNGVDEQCFKNWTLAPETSELLNRLRSIVRLTDAGYAKAS
jgi:hypothetical protein